MESRLRIAPAPTWRRALLSAALAGGLGLNAVHAEIEAFLRLGIPGGKTDPVGAGINDASVPSPAGWFPVHFTGHSVTAVSSWLKGGGATVGKPDPGAFTFTKNVDFASPELFRAIVGGYQFGSAEMVVRHAGAPEGPFYSVMLKEVYLTSLSHSTEESLHAAIENVSLVYRAIEWSYRALDEKGSVEFSTTLNWDVPNGEVQTEPMLGVPRREPYVAPDKFVRLSNGGPVTIPIQTLLGNDAPDAGFDQLPFPETALGGRVRVTGAGVVYTPPTPDKGEEDRFSYAVQNQAGSQSAAMVTLAVRSVKPPELVLTVSAQRVDFRLTAEAGLRYQLQFTDRLGGGWSNVGSPVLASSNGELKWNHVRQADPRYYRVLVLL